jgi:hypothetical protein
MLIYLLVGGAYNKVKNGASGRDIVPNHEFWAAVPVNVHAGCEFSFLSSLACLTGLRGCTKREDAYDALEGPLESERV